MVAKVEDREIELRRFSGDGGLKSCAAAGEVHFAFSFKRVAETIGFVAVDASFLGITLEQRTDGVVPGDAGNVNYRRLDPFFVDAGSVAVFGKVAFRLREMLEKFWLDGFPGTFLGQA